MLDLLSYLGKNPPVHLMVKAYLGIEGKSTKAMDDGEFQQMIAGF